MAVTLTVEELAQELRISTGTARLPEPLAGIMSRLLGACSEMVETYAPLAPDSIHNRACVRLAGFEYFATPTSNRFRNPMHQSGAQALLSPYRVGRAVAVVD